MSISTYEFLSIVLAQRGNEPKVATNSADYMGVLEPMKLSTRGVCASRILPPIRTMRLTISNAASGEAKASSS